MPLKFNQYPYYDDFTPDNLYYRLLFQPGRAVQARELTQIQSLLQNQIESFGNHIFKDGSAVVGGNLTYDKSHTHWLALKPQDAYGNSVRVRDISPGMHIKKSGEAGGVGTLTKLVGRIVNVIPAENQDPDTIYFKWLEGEPQKGVKSKDDVSGFDASENLIICDPDSGVVKYTVTTLEEDVVTGPRHYGTASTLSVEPGIYFWKGMFIKSDGGGVTLLKYNTTPTFRIGYIVNEEIVQNDAKSFDPSQETSNYAAPGADRYKISLSLIKVGNGITFDETLMPNFFEIARIDTGLLLTAPPDRTLYSVLADSLATRTFEESGNYIVEPYMMDGGLQNKTTPDGPKMMAKLTEGVSYVKGHRHSLRSLNPIEINKARNELKESVNIQNDYGDNYLSLYDHANTEISHPENANGFFTIGSGAGQYSSSDLFGNKGAAVSLHCVPHALVIDHSVADKWKWESTLIGTARPIQMARNQKKTKASNDVQRPGDVYDLWLGDFKSSPIANTTSVTNIITGVSAYSNSSWSVYTFPSQSHGLTANDRFSVTGATVSSWNVDFFNVDAANSFAIMSTTTRNAGVAAITDGGLTIYRTTGNTNPNRTIVLDNDSSAAWNDSYVGATISVGNSIPRVITGYVGTNSRAETLHNEKFGWSKKGMVSVNLDLSQTPSYGDSYTLNLTMKQARSAVYNQNITANGTDSFPARLATAWNLDPVSGISGGDSSKLTEEFYGGRIDGDAIYNRHGETSKGIDALLFGPHRSAVKTVKTYGELDTGFSSNTTVYYTEVSVESATTGTVNEQFSPAISSKYLGSNRPLPYPYETASIGHGTAPTASSLEEIRNNFTLHNRTTGKILTRKIILVDVNVSADPATIAVKLVSGEVFTIGQEYVLNYTARIKNLSPAYKKLIVSANSTAGYTSITVPSNNDLTDYSKGHVTITAGAYSNTAGSRIKLNKPDGFKLRMVVEKVDSTTANTDIADASKDVTDRFNFDNGQRDMFYDNCSLVLKDDVNAPTGNLWIGFDYFQRMDKPKGTAGIAEDLDAPSYFSVDSYQWTTDLVFSEMTGTFSSGDKIISNSNIAAYVTEFANTGGVAFAKVRVQDVTTVGESTAAFTVGDSVWKGDNVGVIKEIIPADLRYTEIPKHTTGGERTFLLRNWFDFRPYVSSNNRVSDTISSAIMPTIPTRAGIKTGKNKKTYASHPATMETAATIKSYGGRIDKLIVQADGNYKTIEGTPAIRPLPPKDLPDTEALTLFTMEIPPYTPNPKNVQIKTNLAVRHTMKDISRLAKRIENLEYYVSLNALEKSAADTTITDANGVERFKNGIIVDDFTGFKVMDRRKNRQKAAIGSGVLKSKQKGSPTGTHDIRFTEVPEDLSGTVAISSSSGRHVLMLDYLLAPAITQPYATMPESVNPFDLQNFTGELKLTPDYDRWIDTNKIPDYDVVFRGINESLSIDENSDPQQIIDAIFGMDEIWELISGSISIGDAGGYVQGSVLTTTETPDGTFELENVSRDITLGNLDFNEGALMTIQAAINQHGMLDGVTKDMRILPYIRSRDIIVDAGGLKPNYPAGMLFEEVAVEQFFSPATKIYMRYDDDSQKQFQPEIDGSYEKIVLSDPALTGTHTATAILVAVRDLAGSYQDNKTQSEKIKIGYIVPDFDEETGKIDYSTYKDGYYTTNWSTSDIKSSGFQGLNGTRIVTGQTSGAGARLVADGIVNYYNGHYSGQLRNTSANSTHLVLSPDAHRYVANNFGNDVKDKFTGTPRQTLVKIVAGSGAGQQCLASTIVGYENGCPVLELIRPAGSGTTGISPTVKQGNRGPVDSTSVYSICMRPVDPNIRSHGVSQLGSFGGLAGNFTNSYGDKIGILHLPDSTRTEWTRGRKLVEIVDRLSKTPWLISSYACAYYFAEGKELDTIQSSTRRLEILKEVRSQLNQFKLGDFPMNDAEQVYVPATNNETGIRGKLAVVTGISVANGTYTAEADHDMPFLPGSTEYGEVAERTQHELGHLVTGAWDHIKNTKPDIYEKYFKIFEDTIV